MNIDAKNLGAINAYQKLEQLQQVRVQNGQEDTKNSPNGKVHGLENASMHLQQNISKQELRIEQQASLVSHLFGDGTTTEQSAMRITFQSAIEKINEILQVDLQSNTAELANPQTIDAENASQTDNTNPPLPISEETLQAQGGMEYWTPENTAKRIFEQASSFFSGFETAHPELEGDALMSHFMEVVGGGLTQGFDEARGILDEIGVLEEGDIAKNIDLTYELVQQNMQQYQNDFLAKLTLTAETQTTEP